MPKAIVSRMLPVLPSCILTLRTADPGPPLPEDFNRAVLVEREWDYARPWLATALDSGQ